MYEKKVILKVKKGFHARPAALIVNKVREYGSCRIWLVKGNKTARGESLIEVLSLELKDGDHLTIKVEGEEEAKVAKDFGLFLESENF